MHEPMTPFSSNVPILPGYKTGFLDTLKTLDLSSKSISKKPMDA